MYMCCTKWSSVINLDLFWKQVFSYTVVEPEIGGSNGDVSTQSMVATKIELIKKNYQANIKIFLKLEFQIFT